MAVNDVELFVELARDAHEGFQRAIGHALPTDDESDAAFALNKRNAVVADGYNYLWMLKQASTA